MGFFNKKDKVYPLKEAMKLLWTKKYEGYTTVPVGDGFKLVTQAEGDEHIESYRKQKRGQFLEEISGNGAYRTTSRQYNNWSSAKSYQKQQGIYKY